MKIKEEKEERKKGKEEKKEKRNKNVYSELCEAKGFQREL